MIEYKRVSVKNGVMRYEYYPNGDVSTPGVVEFKDGESPKLIKESPKDIKMYFAIHALNGIDTSREAGVVAWH